MQVLLTYRPSSSTILKRFKCSVQLQKGAAHRVGGRAERTVRTRVATFVVAGRAETEYEVVVAGAATDFATSSVVVSVGRVAK